jgi:hypothetical protein
MDGRKEGRKGHRTEGLKEGKGREGRNAERKEDGRKAGQKKRDTDRKERRGEMRRNSHLISEG